MSSYLNELNHKLDRWIFQSNYSTQRSLGIFRVVYALVVLVFATPNPAAAARYGEFPDSIFYPPLGPMILFSSFPDPVFFKIVTFILIFAGILVLFGLYTKGATLTVAGCLLILDGFAYSFGKINHFSPLIVLPLVMAFSGWGRTYSLDSLRTPNEPTTDPGKVNDGNWNVVLMAFLLGIMMFTAGLSKAGGGWLSFSSQAILNVTIRMNFGWGGPGGILGPYMAGSINSGLFWEALDYAAVLFELGFILACFYRTSLRVFCIVALVFHLTIYLLLGISFHRFLIVYALFVPWDRLFSAQWLNVPGNWIGRWTPNYYRTIVMAPLVTLLAVFFYAVGSPLVGILRLLGADQMLALSAGDVLIYLLYFIAAMIAALSIYVTAIDHASKWSRKVVKSATPAGSH